MSWFFMKMMNQDIIFLPSDIEGLFAGMIRTN